MLYLQTNQQKTIRSLNPIVMVGFFVVCMLIRTTVFWIFPGFISNWDLLLPFMIYFGQRRPLFEGLLLWFVLAHIYTLQSVAPVGVFVIYYLLIFVIARLVSEAFFATEGLQILGLISVLVILSRLLLPIVAQSFHAGWPIASWRNWHYGLILTNIFGGWLCFMILSLLDKLTAKDARQVLELGEGLT